jgi:hypothetical protein
MIEVNHSHPAGARPSGSRNVPQILHQGVGSLNDLRRGAEGTNRSRRMGLRNRLGSKRSPVIPASS